MTHISHRSHTARRRIPTPKTVRDEPKRETGLPVISDKGTRFVADLSAAVEHKRKGPVRRVSKSKENLKKLGIPRNRWWRA